MSPSPPTIATTSDLEEHLDHILQKLPQHERDTLLLRYVHDHSLAQIAVLTHTNEEAAKKRLHRAMQKVRAHFTDRGFSLPAAIIPTALVPTHLATTTITTALSPASAVAPAILQLSHGASHMLLAAKLKLIAAILLITTLATGLTGILLAQNTPKQQAALPAPVAPVIAATPTPPTLAPATAPEIPDELLTVHGLILDPAGKPLPNANISVPAPYKYNDHTTRPIIQTTSDSEGHYSLSFHKSAISPFSDGAGSSNPDTWKKAPIVASHEGFGMAWSIWNKTDPAGNLNLQLVPDDFPIEGQILSADGKAAPNTHILVTSLNDYTAKTWEETYQKNTALLQNLPPSLANPLASIGHPEPILTDAQGRFRITGLGQNRWLHLTLYGRNAGLSTIEAVTQNAESYVRTYKVTGTAKVPTITVYGSKFTLTAPQSFNLEGTVRDAVTHLPLANVTVMGSEMTENYQNLGNLSALTDLNGHYHLDGVPTGGQRTFIALTNDDQPYLMREIESENPPTLPTTTLDFDLHRGIWITGTVTDKLTRKPVAARIEYTAYVDNPATLHLPEFKQFPHGGGTMDGEQDRYETQPDGSYRIVAVPGKGVLGVICYGDRKYRTGLGADKIPAYTSTARNATSLALYQHYPFMEFDNIITEVDVPTTGPGPVLNFQLDPGSIIHATIVDAAGKPVTNCFVEHSTIAGHGSDGKTLGDSAAFDITALSPDENRSLIVANIERKLGTIFPFTLSDAKNGSITIPLHPLAEITGRCLDPTGKPVANVSISVSSQEADDVGAATTDAEGKFHCPVIPGANLYEAHVNRGTYFMSVISKQFSIDPGDSQDLGDIYLKTSRRRN